MEHYKGTPTVYDKTESTFNPKSDAERLHKAMKDSGTDEHDLVKILGNRTNPQRISIAEIYKTLYGKDLKDEFKSELSGNFRKVMIAMITPPIEFYADQLHDAMSGPGTNEDVLIEFMTTCSNSDIKAIRKVYERKYRRSLENDLKGDTSGCFRHLMVSLCTANREEGPMMNTTVAEEDAKQLIKDDESRAGIFESRFNEIFCQRSYSHLRAVFHEYELLTGHSIEKGIEKHFSSDAKSCLMAIVESVRSMSAFFAKRLHESMQGYGTNDDRLIRIIVTRSEIDMADIKDDYERMYCKSLKHDIKDETSGDYRRILMCLIAEDEN